MTTEHKNESLVLALYELSQLIEDMEGADTLRELGYPLPYCEDLNHVADFIDRASQNSFVE